MTASTEVAAFSALSLSDNGVGDHQASGPSPAAARHAEEVWRL